MTAIFSFVITFLACFLALRLNAVLEAWRDRRKAPEPVHDDEVDERKQARKLYLDTDGKFYTNKVYPAEGKKK